MKQNEVGKLAELAELDEPLPNIELTQDECKVLKQVVFRNFLMDLDPVHRKVADKEVLSINKIVSRSLRLGIEKVKQPKALKTVVKENIKDYKGLMSSAPAGMVSPVNKKLLDHLVADAKQLGPGAKLPTVISGAPLASISQQSLL